MLAVRIYLRARLAQVAATVAILLAGSPHVSRSLPVLPRPGRWTPSSSQHSFITVHTALLRDTADTRFHSRVIMWNDDDSGLEGVDGSLFGWRPNATDTCASYPDTAYFQLLTGADALAAPDFNIFCAGHVQLFDKFLVAGGTEYGETGLVTSKFYDPAANRWSDTGDMHIARWYPSLVELPSGGAMVSGGTIYAHMYQYGGKTASTGTVSDALRRLGLRLYAGGQWEDSTRSPSRSGGSYGWAESREGHTFTEDPEAGDRPPVVFGGRDSNGHYRSDAWFLRQEERSFNKDVGYYFDRLSPAGDLTGLKRADHCAVNGEFDDLHTELFVIGGQDSVGVRPDIWRLYYDAGIPNYRWSKLELGDGGPMPLYGHTAIYDKFHQRILVFGGAHSTGSNPTDSTLYALDVSDPTGTCEWSTPTVSAPDGRPGPRIGATLTIRPLIQRRIESEETLTGVASYLFGGQRTTSSSSVTNDAWQLWMDTNPANTDLEWVRLSPDSTAPPARAWHSAFYDIADARIVFVGGESGLASVGKNVAGLFLGRHADDLIPPTFHYHWMEMAEFNEANGISHGAAIQASTVNARRAETTPAGSTPSWTMSSAPYSYRVDPWYPFLFVMPDGRVFNAGSGNGENRWSAVFDPSTHRWLSYPLTSGKQSMFYPGSAAMYLPGKVMACGSRDEWFNADSVDTNANHTKYPAVPYTQWIDLSADSSSAAWANSINNMQKPRVYHNLVVLPTGEVMAVGGLTHRISEVHTKAARQPEIWFPDTLDSGHRGYWRILTTDGDSLAASQLTRDYHSTALLMPDGRIMCAGGNVNGAAGRQFDFYCPPYLFNRDGTRAKRPAFATTVYQVPPGHITYGQTFFVCVDTSTVLADLDSVVLIKPGSVTHGFDEDQRFIRLATTYCGTGQRLTVVAPGNANLAPPGDYLMFLVYKNLPGGSPPRFRTPSIAQWVRLGPQYESDPVCASCSGGGCPEVDVKTASGWATDNTILGRSLQGQLANDAYRLQHVPTTANGTLTLRLRENEQEVTTLDDAKLLAVDHEPGLTVLGSGDGVVVGAKVPAYRVTWRGQEITDLVNGMDGALGWWGSAGDTVVVELDAPQAGFHASAVQDGGGGVMGGDPKEEELRYDPNQGGAKSARLQPTAQPSLATDAEWLTRTGVIIQRLDGSGAWNEVGHWHPRQFAAESYFPELGHGTTRLIFAGRHRLSFLGRLSTGGSATVQTLSPTSALHNRLGSVGGVLATVDSTTFLAPGDTLTLTFSVPERAPGTERDYVLLTRGVYTTVPGVARMQPRSELPPQFALLQNRPNPFASATTIQFELPAAVKVKLEIFDLMGRRIRTLTNAQWPAGYHKLDWDRRTDDGTLVRSGVFSYRINAGSFHDTKKMVLLAR